MKSILVLGAIYISGGLGDAAEDWACNFVGLRLARTPSKCVMGMCDSPTVSCERARGLVLNIAHAVTKSDSAIDVDSFRLFLRETGRNSLRMFLIGAKVDMHMHKLVLQDIDSFIASLYLKSPEVLSSLKISAEVIDLNLLASEIVNQSLKISALEDVRNPTSDLSHYHFLLDWISWFGLPPGTESRDLLPIQVGSMAKASQYREIRFPHEIRLGNEDQQSMDSEAFIQLVDLIDELGNRLSRYVRGESSQKFRFTRQLGLLTMRWNIGLQDAVTGIVIEHISKSDLCRNIVSLPTMTRKDWSVAWHKTVVTYLELCRPSASTTDIVLAGFHAERASFGLSHVWKVPPNSWSDEQLVRDFIENPKQYLPGLQIRDKSLADMVNILKEFRSLTGVIRPCGDFFSPSDFLDTPEFSFRARLRALGHGIGAILVSKSALLADKLGDVLMLRPEIVRAIHSPPADCPIDLLDVIYDLRVGIREGMGGLGIAAFTMDQWEHLFSPGSESSNRL